MDEATDRLLRRAYEAFNARDLDAALSTMHADVDWPNAIEGGRVIGQGEIRRYWFAQFEDADPQVEPTAIRELPDGRFEVAVHQVVRDLEGNLVAEQDVVHVYSLRDGLVERMEIAEPAA